MTEATRLLAGEPGANLPSADLMRECGQRLTDFALWQTFHVRFHRHITTYVIRSVRIFKGRADADLTCDLVQEVYLRLLQGVMPEFRGDSDFSAQAFLGRITMNVVSDHFRSQMANKRRPAEIISIDEAREREELSSTAENLDITSILSWIDVNRLIESDPDHKNATRNVLVFKLYYINGLSTREIAQYDAFSLTESGVEKVLRTLRAQLKKRLGQ
jgi:RNA polymerase sigma factor (sigma-70 family)